MKITLNGQPWIDFADAAARAQLAKNFYEFTKPAPPTRTRTSKPLTPQTLGIGNGWYTPPYRRK